jgi:hypothetical protein
MKKLFFSAILMIAFSVTSFASTKEVDDSAEVKKESVVTDTTQKDDNCTTHHIRWNDVEDDGEGGMILIYHRAELTICDDGTSTITGY